MKQPDLYLMKIDAVAGEGCRYETGRAMRLLVICKARSGSEAADVARAPLQLEGWTETRMVDVAPLDSDPEQIPGVPGAATRYASVNGYALIAYPA